MVLELSLLCTATTMLLNLYIATITVQRDIRPHILLPSILRTDPEDDRPEMNNKSIRRESSTAIARPFAPYHNISTIYY